jgi:Fe-S-cluster-containing hydrogenase component 2
MTPYDCAICERRIAVEASGNSPGDHDPAGHVARAYHVNVSGKCQSCGQPWPCRTHLVYGPKRSQKGSRND